MAVLGSPSLIFRKVSVDVKKKKCYFQGSGAVWKSRWMFLTVRTVSVDVKQHLKKRCYLSVAEFKSCVKVEVHVLGSPSLIAPTVSVDVKQYLKERGSLTIAELRSCMKVDVALTP